MLQRPGESYAVWHFWQAPGRAFAGWYLNLQEPFRRTAAGYDTHDLELDVWIPAAGSWSVKDDDLLEERVRQGRFTETEGAEIRALGDEIGTMVDAGDEWWDPSWSSWQPDPDWVAPTPPEGWEQSSRARDPPLRSSALSVCFDRSRLGETEPIVEAA